MEPLVLSDPPRGPLSCDLCGRFVAVKEARLTHEFGDYGSILSTEVLCPKCGAGRGSDTTGAAARNSRPTFTASRAKREDSSTAREKD